MCCGGEGRPYNRSHLGYVNLKQVCRGAERQYRCPGCMMCTCRFVFFLVFRSLSLLYHGYADLWLPITLLTCGCTTHAAVHLFCVYCGSNSLKCCLSHKSSTGCSGRRDKTAYISLSNFDEKHICSDLFFLEDVMRLYMHQQLMVATIIHIIYHN